MSDRWWRRKRRVSKWFTDFLNEPNRPQKDPDEIVHRVFATPSEREKARRRYSGEIANQFPSHSISSQINKEHEPLVDVFANDAYITILVELLGVDKTAIDLHATEDKLVISVDSPDLKYRREVELPSRVDVKSSSSKLRNGVLEIRLKKLSEKVVIK